MTDKKHIERIGKSGGINFDTKLKTNTMKKIIFKSEKKAKVYEIRSTKNQGVYKAGEIIRVIKTDNINELINEQQYGVEAIEIKID